MLHQMSEWDMIKFTHFKPWWCHPKVPFGSLEIFYLSKTNFCRIKICSSTKGIWLNTLSSSSSILYLSKRIYSLWTCLRCCRRNTFHTSAPTLDLTKKYNVMTTPLIGLSLRYGFLWQVLVANLRMFKIVVLLIDKTISMVQEREKNVKDKLLISAV